MKRKISRPHIDMVIEESTNVLLPKRKNKQTTMDEDFNDVMSDVRGYEPNLFVPEDESDGAYEESTTQSFLTSQTNASNADRKEGVATNPLMMMTSKITTTMMMMMMRMMRINQDLGLVGDHFTMPQSPILLKYVICACK